MLVVQLTNQFLKSNLTCPDNKAHIEYCDQSVLGLYVEEQKDKPPVIESLTFQTFMEEKYLPYAVIHKRSHRFDESMCRLRIIPKFGNLRLEQITRQDFQVFHNDLHDEDLAPPICNHHIQLICYALNLAVDWGLLHQHSINTLVTPS